MAVSTLGAAAVYPRVCGGTRGSLANHPQRWGLSPRVRGNRYAAAAHAVFLRSIPACAGEPGIVKRGQTLWKVYPRVCGGTAMMGIWCP